MRTLLTRRPARPPDMPPRGIHEAGAHVELTDDPLRDLLCAAWPARPGFPAGRYAAKARNGFLPARTYAAVTLIAGCRARPVPLVRWHDVSVAGGDAHRVREAPKETAGKALTTIDETC